MKNWIKVSLLCFGVLGMASCGSTKLNVSDVGYQSVRNVRHSQLKPLSALPKSTDIVVMPRIDDNGDVDVTIVNATDSIMIIDRTKSFFVSPSGVSTIYYDPTIQTQTNSVTVGHQNGASVNLGAIGGALGVGGAVGQVLDGVNVGGSKLNSNTQTNTTYKIDTPTGAVAPRGRASMGRIFSIDGLGSEFFKGLSSQTGQRLISKECTSKDSYCKFSICISYSLDNGKTFDKIVSNFYANSVVISPVVNKGKVNDALRDVMTTKRDLFNEPWHMLYFNCNIPVSSDNIISNQLYDYK